MFLVLMVLALGVLANSATSNDSQLNNNKRLLSVQERLNIAADDVKSFSINSLDKSEVLISFSEAKSKNFVQEIAGGNNLEVKTIYHIFKGKNNQFSGAYFVPQNQNLNEAILKYEQGIKETIDFQVKENEVTLMKYKEKLALMLRNRSTTDEKYLEEEKSVNSLLQLLEDQKERQSVLHEKGLELYGLKVVAKNDVLAKLAINPAIKSIEKISGHNVTWSPIVP